MLQTLQLKLLKPWKEKSEEQDEKIELLQKRHKWEKGIDYVTLMMEMNAQETDSGNQECRPQGKGHAQFQNANQFPLA